MPKKPGAKAYFMISAVAQKYSIHPQTLRLYGVKVCSSHRGPRATRGSTRRTIRATRDDPLVDP